MLDPTTGLPPLPEGQHWKVVKREDDWAGTAYMLILMKEVPKTFLNFIRTQGSYTKYVYGVPIGSSVNLPDEEDVLDGADEILERLSDQEHADSLLGNYPPKKVT